MKDLKEKTIRGGAARIVAQGANFAFRIGSVMIIARLLAPEDFGLVGMVTAFTGVLNLFRDFGLSTATVQREEVTEEQLSTLFWINMLVGVILAILAVVLAPVVVRIYNEPRLLGITMVLSLGFLFNAAGIQHSALLQRHLRFTALAVINVASLVVAALVAIGMAKMGYGYWALVGQTVTVPLTLTVGTWIAAAWIPGRPRRSADVHALPLARHDRDRRADLHSVGALRNKDFRDFAFVDRLELHRRLVGLDLGEDVARLHVVALLDQPFGERAFLHRRRQGGHLDLDGHKLGSPQAES